MTPNVLTETRWLGVMKRYKFIQTVLSISSVLVWWAPVAIWYVSGLWSRLLLLSQPIDCEPPRDYVWWTYIIWHTTHQVSHEQPFQGAGKELSLVISMYEELSLVIPMYKELSLVIPMYKGTKSSYTNVQVSFSKALFLEGGVGGERETAKLTCAKCLLSRRHSTEMP